MSKNKKTDEKLTEFLLYKNPNGDIKIDVFLQNETIWLPQKKIAQLFDVGVPAISKHLKNIFETKELEEKVVVSILEIPTQHGAIEGKTQINQTKFYNLDAIIAVGYRVNSLRATQFRIWATNVLKEFIIKGYTMDVERLKNNITIYVDKIIKKETVIYNLSSLLCEVTDGLEYINIASNSDEMNPEYLLEGICEASSKLLKKLQQYTKEKP